MEATTASRARIGEQGRDRPTSPRSPQDLSEALEAAAAIVELLQILQSAADLPQFCQRLVDELQRYAGCQRVAVGICRGRQGECRVAALSGMSRFDRHAEQVAALESVFQETILRGEGLSVWPPQEDSQRPAMLAHQRLCRVSESRAVVSSPLRDAEGRIVGAWAFLGDEQLLRATNVLRLAEACQPLVGGQLELVRRAGRFARLRRWLPGRRNGLKWRLALYALLGAALLLALPRPYSVRCDVQLQPVQRRFVAAPFDATLDKSLVSPGDLVSRNEIWRGSMGGRSAGSCRASKPTGAEPASAAIRRWPAATSQKPSWLAWKWIASSSACSS